MYISVSSLYKINNYNSTISVQMLLKNSPNKLKEKKNNFKNPNHIKDINYHPSYAGINDVIGVQM